MVNFLIEERASLRRTQSLARTKHNGVVEATTGHVSFGTLSSAPELFRPLMQIGENVHFRCGIINTGALWPSDTWVVVCKIRGVEMPPTAIFTTVELLSEGLVLPFHTLKIEPHVDQDTGKLYGEVSIFSQLGEEWGNTAYQVQFDTCISWQDVALDFRMVE
jgi:hypothetical protein